MEPVAKAAGRSENNEVDCNSDGDGDVREIVVNDNDVFGVGPASSMQPTMHLHSNLIPLCSHVIGGVHDQVEKVKQCNCSRSNCLKLYCECFAAGIHCSTDCTCCSCKNDGSPENEKIRNNAILSSLDKTSQAFRARLINVPIVAGDDDEMQLPMKRSHVQPGVPIVASAADKRKDDSSSSHHSGLAVMESDSVGGEFSMPKSPIVLDGKSIDIQEETPLHNEASDNATIDLLQAPWNENPLVPPNRSKGREKSSEKKRRFSSLDSSESVSKMFQVELKSVREVHFAMRKELDERRREQLSSLDNESLPPENMNRVEPGRTSYGTRMSTALLASVELDLESLVSAKKVAREWAGNLSPTRSVGRSLKEKGAKSNVSETVPSAEENILAMEAVEESAIMRKLSYILRRQAIEMSEKEVLSNEK